MIIKNRSTNSSYKGFYYEFVEKWWYNKVLIVNFIASLKGLVEFSLNLVFLDKILNYLFNELKMKNWLLKIEVQTLLIKFYIMSLLLNIDVTII